MAPPGQRRTARPRRRRTSGTSSSGRERGSVSQWRVAELNPPHLAAINPWEGWSDTYREVARHGGIPETSFWPYIWERWGASTGQIEDLEQETIAHPFFDEFWETKAARLERIRVPAWVVGSWSVQGLHSRGTLDGFRRMGSAQKWLDIHGRKKWAEYYRPENVERQRQFFEVRGVDLLEFDRAGKITRKDSFWKILG